jgi:hypothetical protein
MSGTGERDTLSWPGAVVRGLSPLRLALCLGGLAVTVVAVALVLAWFEGHRPDPLALVQGPPARTGQALASLFRHSSAAKHMVRALALGALLLPVWGLVGGWIARAEFQAQRPSADPSKSVFGFARDKALTLMIPGPFIIFLLGCLSLFIWPYSAANVVIPKGIGSTLIAVTLALPYLLCLLVVLTALGAFSFWIMPAAIAAEGSDCWDALSRSYSYLFQRPITFLAWGTLATVVAALPLAAGYGLTTGDQPVLDPAAQAPLWAACAVFSLSLFWSLQPLVYVRLRASVDGTLETDWAGSPAPGEAKAFVSDLPAQPDPEAEGAPGPRRAHFTFEDTLYVGHPSSFNTLAILLLGAAGVGLLGALALWIVWATGAPPGQPWSLAAQGHFVLQRAEQSPVVFALGLAGVIVLGSLWLGRPVKVAARRAAVRAVFGQSVNATAAHAFVRRTGSGGWGGVLLLTVGTLAYLTALWALVVAVQARTDWREPVLFLGVAVPLYGLGALALAPGVVESQGQYSPAGSPLASYLGSGPEMVGSAAAALVVGAVRSAGLLAIGWLTWWLLADGLTWVSRWNNQWIRWGLDGQLVPRLVPPAAGGLYSVARGLAGCWFFFLAGLALMYPLSYALRWGVLSYLRARQQAGNAPAEALELTGAERASLAQRQKRFRGAKPAG